MPQAQPSYEAIFEQQGVPQEFRGPEDYFFHTVTEAESIEHAGEIYAIPRAVNLDGATYQHRENGAIISNQAELDTQDSQLTIEGRAIIHPYAQVTGRSQIGWNTVVGYDARVSSSNIDSNVEVGPKAIVDMADIGPRSKLGQVIIRGVLQRSKIGSEVTLDDGVRLDGDNAIGSYSKLHSGARMFEGAAIGQDVTLDERATVKEDARVEDHSRVMAYTAVSEGRRIRPNTIVVPEHYRRARKGSRY